MCEIFSRANVCGDAIYFSDKSKPKLCGPHDIITAYISHL